MPSLHIQPLGSSKPAGHTASPPTGKAQAASAPASQPHARSAGISVEANAGYETAQPPVDSARVSQIRAAIESGTYPVVPARIADAMIAARLFLSIGE